MPKILFVELANLKYIYFSIFQVMHLYIIFKDSYKVHHTNSRENLESDIFIFFFIMLLICFFKASLLNTKYLLQYIRFVWECS